MIIRQNISAVNAHRILKFNLEDASQTMKKLSSGMRINDASDDASGLAVSEKMRTQVNGLRQAERNTEDGMSFIQTTDGFLDQMSEILQRVRVLAVQSSNGIYTQGDRKLMQMEVSQLIDEVDRIASQAEFNRQPLLQGTYVRGSQQSSMWFHVGANMHQREQFFIRTMTANALKLKNPGTGTISISSARLANEVIGIVDAALENLVNQRANLGAYYNRLETTAKGLMSAYENVQAGESRIRDADMAEEMVKYTSQQILIQSGMAMLAQANSRPQQLLPLLNDF